MRSSASTQSATRPNCAARYLRKFLQAGAEMCDWPIFEVRIMDAGGLIQRHYGIWEDGRTEGFEDGDKPVLVINRIPHVVREAVNTALSWLPISEAPKDGTRILAVRDGRHAIVACDGENWCEDGVMFEM